MVDLVVGQSVALRGEVASLIEGSFPFVGVRFGAVVAYVPPANVEPCVCAGDFVVRVVDLKLYGSEAPRWRVRALGDDGALLTPCEGARRERYERFPDIRPVSEPSFRPEQTLPAGAASPP